MKLRSHAKSIQPEQHLLPGEVSAVNYPDATPLDRPIRHSWKHVPLIFLAFAVAVGVAGYAIWQTYDKLVVAPEPVLPAASSHS